MDSGAPTPKTFGRGRLVESSSDPGQPGAAPASYMIALPAGVLVALEAFEHVVAIGITRFEGESGGAVGAPAAAAKKQHERFLST